MNNQIQVVLKSSTTEMSLNDHDAGIYIVPELDGLTGLPEIRTTSGVNAGYDGGWTSAQKFDARSIVIRGVIANDDKTEVERMRRELVALLAQGKNEQLELDFVTETGRAYEVQVRTIACDMAMQRVLTQQEFMITLRADDPLIYDNSSTGEEATVNISGATGGFRIPFEIPLAIDAGSEETVVQNSGLESVAPTIKMYGALHNPKIINHTTNQAMQVEAELGFTEGAWTTPVDAPEGANVSFEPEREAPIESAKLKGNTTQQTYTGKNLLNTHGTIDADSLTGSGVSYTINADGTISTSGSNSGVYKSIRFLLTLPAGTYKFSGCPSGGTNNGYSFCVEPRGDSTLQLFDTGNGNEFTLTEQKTIRAYPIRIGADTGVNMNGKLFKPMITVSTAEQTYEPYVGGTPAPNPDYPQAVKTVTGEQTITINGTNYTVDLTSKNLFNIAGDLTYGGYPVSPTNNGDGTLTTTANYNSQRASGQKINCISGETYTVSGKLVSHTGTGNTSVVEILSGLVGGVTVVKREYITVDGSFSYSFVAPADVSKLWISFSSVGAGTQATFGDIQIEAGSQASSYAPYFEPIELCKIGDYQDYIWKDGDTWKVHKAVDKVVFDGTEEGWEQTTAYTDYFRGLIKIGGKPADYAGFCDHFTVRTGGHGGYNYVWNFLGDNSKYVQIEQSIIGGNTLALFKAWLSQNNVNWYYSLATPTDTAITNAALIEQLEALVDGNAVVYEGETNIAVTAAEGDMPGIAAIRYYTDKEPDQRDELIIDSRLKTITLNGLDVYHLQAPGSEFLMLAPGENKLSLQSDITGDNGYAKVSYKQGYLSI